MNEEPETTAPDSIETAPEMEPSPAPRARLGLPKTRWVVVSISPHGELALEVDASFDRKAPPPTFVAYKVAAIRKGSSSPDAPIVVFPNPLQKAGMMGPVEFRRDESAFFGKVLKPLLDLLADAYHDPGNQKRADNAPKGPRLAIANEADLKAIDSGQPRG